MAGRLLLSAHTLIYGSSHMTRLRLSSGVRQVGVRPEKHLPCVAIVTSQKELFILWNDSYFSNYNVESLYRFNALMIAAK